MQAPQQSVDWTQLPSLCRSLLVRHMDVATRAAWRTVCSLARQDLHAASDTLTWRGGDEAHLANVPLPMNTPLDPSPTTLPTSLFAQLPNLRHVNCSHMSSVTTLQGLPTTLRSLNLRFLDGIDGIAPLQRCTMLEELKVMCFAQDDMPALMSSFGPRLRRLELDIYDVDTEAAAKDAVRSLEPLTGLQELSVRLWPLAGDLPYLLTPDCWSRLAQVIGRMTDLQSLTLPEVDHDQDPPGPAMSELAPAIRQLTRLRSLVLFGIGMDSTATAAVAQAIVALPATLTKLTLEKANVSTANVAAINAALQAHAATLKSINLSSSLGPDNIASLVPSLRRCLALTALDLCGCRIDPSGAAALVTALSGSAPSLTSLNMAENRLRDHGAQALAPLLSCMTRLVELDFHDNAMGFAGAAALGPALSSIAPSLTALDISASHLSYVNFVQLAPALRRMTALQRLVCSRVNMGVEGAVAVASAVPSMTKLRHVDLTCNPLGWKGLEVMAAGLQVLARGQNWKVYFPSSAFIAEGRLRQSEDAQWFLSLMSGLSCLRSLEVLNAFPNHLYVGDAPEGAEDAQVLGLLVDVCV